MGRPACVSEPSRMTLRTARILVAAGAFVAGLVLCTAVVLLVTGRSSVPNMPQVAAIGGPFSLTDHNGRTFTEAGPERGSRSWCSSATPTAPTSARPRCSKSREVLKKLGPGGGPHPRTVHHRRSGTRHAGGAERTTSRKLRPPHHRADRRARGDRRRGQGLPRLATSWGAAEGRRLHHGPLGPGLSDGQGLGRFVSRFQPGPAVSTRRRRNCAKYL